MKTALKSYYEDVLKNYFKNIFGEVSKIELIYWWILRGLMLYALFDTIFNGNDYNGSNPPAQIIANLVGMFAYEIIQFFPKNNRMRLLSPHFQDITALGFFLGSFGGAYLNLYYALPLYDKILHATGTAEAVFVGYEYVCATQLKYKKTCPKQIATLCAMGFGFILSCAWEVFEFTYDQFFGGDAQHWNYATALAEAGGDPDKIFFLFPLKEEIVQQRFALMDTMGDMVLNFAGALIMYAILVAVPYRHRGKNDINAKIEEMQRKSLEAQKNA